MCGCISIGQYNKYYKYVLLTPLFFFLTNFIFGIYYNNKFNLKISDFYENEKENFFKFKYSIVHDVFRYFVILIFGIIYFICQRRSNAKLKNKNDKLNNKYNTTGENANLSSTILLIHNSPEELFNFHISALSIVSLMIIWILQKYLIDLLYKYGLIDHEFWMFEIIIVSLFSSKILNTETYKHQKCAIYFICIICGTLKIFTFIISLIFSEDINSIYNEIYNDNKVVLLPLGIALFFINMILRSYVNTKIKWIMDLKYISPGKILILYGFLGTIISLIICTITTFIFGEEKNDYIDNFLIYIKNLQNLIPEESSKFIYEILVVFFGSITNFFYTLYYLLTIKCLTPVHAIFSNSIYFFFLPIFLLSYNIICKIIKINNNDDTNEINKDSNIIYYRHLIEIIGEFFGIIGFMIYLELIELNCCELNYNLRKNIMIRSIIESNPNSNIFHNDSLYNRDEEEDKESFSSEKA